MTKTTPYPVFLKNLNYLLCFCVLLTQALSASVDPVNYGATPDDSGNNAGAIQAAINTGNDVVFTQAGVYCLEDRLYLMTDGQKISANVDGVVLVATASVEMIIKLLGNYQTVSGLSLDSNGLATYGVKLGSITPNAEGIGNTIDSCDFYGSVGHHILAYGFDVTVTNNRIYGTGATHAIPVVFSYVNGFTCSGNMLNDNKGFGFQTRWSSNGIFEDNIVRNPTYIDEVVVSVNGQSILNFEMPVDVYRAGIEVNDVAYDNYQVSNYTLSPANLGAGHKAFTVTLNSNLANGLVIGDTVKFFGWRSYENFNINAGSRDIIIRNNEVIGSGDSNYVIATDYNDARAEDGDFLDQTNPPVGIVLENNTARNALGAGIALTHSLKTSEMGQNPWTDLKYNTQGGVPAWDSRVKINTNGQLEVFTGYGESGLWIPAQENLPQSPSYRVSWDQGSSGGWSFVRLNSNALVDTPNDRMEFGFLVNGSTVALYEDGVSQLSATFNNPTGEGGLHHIDCSVENGQLIAVINEDYANIWRYDLSSTSTGTTGIGNFSIHSLAMGASGYLDNFKYYAIDTTTALSEPFYIYDFFNVGATNNQNADLATAFRQGAPFYKIDGFVSTDAALVSDGAPWSTFIFDSSGEIEQSAVEGKVTEHNVPAYLYSNNEGPWIPIENRVDAPYIDYSTVLSPDPNFASYVGFFDSINANYIKGWCWDSSRRDQPLYVEIYDGDTLLAQVCADEFRQDLATAGYGNGYHGWKIPTPASLMDGQSHQISVKILEVQRNLLQSPKTYQSL